MIETYGKRELGKSVLAAQHNYDIWIGTTQECCVLFQTNPGSSTS